MLALARTSGCRVFQSATTSGDTGSELVLLLIDGREALVGTLEPAERCQAITSANKALAAALDGYFAQQMSPVHIISSGLKLLCDHHDRGKPWSLDNELSHPTSVPCCHAEPFAALRVNSAKGLSRWAERCFPFASSGLRLTRSA